jgi:prepilin-type N-terminal cleavage/methylation domain-containing protein
VKDNMKKLKSNGFTLIELLAVITIMGILMMVAIPSVSRTIENSRRDTFADIALNYIDAVRNSLLADELKCYAVSGSTVSTTGSLYSSLPDGGYVFYLDTAGSYVNNPTSSIPVNQNTLDLMESGGTSSWGGAPVFGYVYWIKDTNDSGTTKTTYAIVLQDSGKHGISTLQNESNIGRSTVSSTVSSTIATSSTKLTALTGTTTAIKTLPTTNTGTVNYVCGLA